jgi:hypothetical protein
MSKKTTLPATCSKCGRQQSPYEKNGFSWAAYIENGRATEVRCPECQSFEIAKEADDNVDVHGIFCHECNRMHSPEELARIEHTF